MKTKSILITASSLIATTLLALEPPPVGSAAPGFSLTDAKGKTHSLADYKGKYVVLEWFNPECPFVKKHYGGGNMQNLQKEFTEHGHHQSRWQNRLRRRDRQQSHAESR